MSAQAFAAEMSERGVLVKALAQQGLADNFVRFTTSTPDNNARALDAVEDVLRSRSFSASVAPAASGRGDGSRGFQ